MHTNLISQYLHFDSINSSYIYDSKNTSGNTSNCFKATFPMTQAFRKIKRVWLKSLEMPINFPNIRTGSTNTLIFTMNGTKYTTSLSETNYTSISTLCTAITTAVATTISGSGATMTFAVNSSKITITTTGVSSFSWTDTNLSKYILGFRTTDTFASNSITGSCNYNLSPDNYINIYMPTFNAYNANQTGSWSSFKLPLNSVIGNVYYYQDENSFTQSIDIRDDNLVMSQLQVIIYDRFGNNINPNGADWSFTLKIDYEL